MTTTEARWPSAPDDVRSPTNPDAHLDAAIEAVLFAAVSDLARTVGLVDGTRSGQVARWASEFERVVS